ncbi:reverse transcriptase domain-containing protein [Tanacetum coccineum]
MELHPLRINERFAEKVLDMESKEELEEDPQDDSEKEGKPKKKRLKEASESNSNTLPPDYTSLDEKTETDLDSTIVTQVTNNVNNANANGNGGNGGNNGGCTYKEFLACKPRDFDGKGVAIALTRWIEKIESVMDISGCVNNQKVRYAASSLINKALTWWNTQLQARGCKVALGMTWEEFKALLVEELCPSNEMEKVETKFWNHVMVGANHATYTDLFHELAKLVPHLVTPKSKYIERCETLSKSSEKRKEVAESSKQGGLWTNNKRAKVGKGFKAAVPTRNEYADIYPRCAKCNAHHPVSIPCLLCYNCQKPGHFARDCQSTKNAAPVNAIRMGNNQKVCYEYGSPDHFRNTCPKLN